MVSIVDRVTVRVWTGLVDVGTDIGFDAMVVGCAGIGAGATEDATAVDGAGAPPAELLPFGIPVRGMVI